MSDEEPRAVAYTGNESDSVAVNTTNESISIWEQVENMMAADITVGEVNALRDEIERLRSLITAWADAEDALTHDVRTDTLDESQRGIDVLRKAIGR